MHLKQLFYLVLLLTPCLGYSQVFPINFNYYDFVPNIDDHFWEVDSVFLINRVQKVTTLCRTTETDSLRLFKVQHFESGRKVKDEQYELATGKLERLIQYNYSPGKLEVEMMHYPSVENGYRLPARRFDYLLNAAYVYPYQPDSLGRIKISLSYTWKSNGDILYETFDFKGNCIVREMMTVKPGAFQMLQSPKLSYPRIVKKAVDEYNNEEFHYNKWRKLSIYKQCDPRNAYGRVHQYVFDDRGLQVCEQHFEESPTNRKLLLEYIFICQ